MLPARLIGRCPSARVFDLGVAQHYRLEFSKVSKDGSAKATIVAAPGSRLPGVIFEIHKDEQAALDKHEGLGFGYKRGEDFLVEGVRAANTLLTTTYIATSSNTKLKPFDWYLATIIAGAIHHKIDEKHITELRATTFIEDHEKDRDTRVIALKAMQEHGIADYWTILRA
jgi:hypothetical protein